MMKGSFSNPNSKGSAKLGGKGSPAGNPHSKGSVKPGAAKGVMGKNPGSKGKASC